jgi:hypothetical protein
MKTLQFFSLPDAPESTVELPLNVGILDAVAEGGNIHIFIVDDESTDDHVTLTFYVLGELDEIADNFPGKFFKRVEVEGEHKFIFFKQNAKKREPIVAQVPGAKPKGAE